MEVWLYWEYDLLPFWPLGKLLELNTRCCGPFYFLHCFCCMRWGITQTSSSHSSSTLLPCNFSVECPTHPPHITAPSLTPPTPWKTSHASTYTATWPKYTAPTFPFFSLHALTLHMPSPPQASLCVMYICVCVFACVNVCTLQYIFFSPRKASIILMTITTCISICRPQMSRRAVVWLRSERAPKERRKQRQETSGPLSGDLLPTQGPALSTPAHTQLQRHTDDSREAVFEQWQQGLEQSDCSTASSGPEHR